MRRLGLLSAMLCTGCLDWITVIPSDYMRLDAGPRPAAVVDGGGADAGPAGTDTGTLPAFTRNRSCSGTAYQQNMTLCLRFNAEHFNQAPSGVQPQGYGRNPSYARVDGSQQNQALFMRTKVLGIPEEAATYTNAFTLSAWVSPENYGVQGPIFAARLANGSNNTVNMGPFRLDFVDGKPKLVLFPPNDSPVEAIAPEALDLNGYTHVAALFDIGRPDYEARLYVNGALVAVEVQTDSLQPRQNQNNGGAHQDGIGTIIAADGPEFSAYGSSFDGYIDDLRVWNQGKSDQFLALEAGRWVDNFEHALVEGWTCAGDQPIAMQRGDYAGGVEFPSTCQKSYFASPQPVTQVRWTIGPLDGDYHSEFSVELASTQGGSIPLIWLRADREYFAFGNTGWIVPNCGYGNGQVVRNFTATFDWTARTVSLSCGNGEGQTVTVDLPDEMTGIDTFEVDPSGSGHLWLDDIEWSLR